METDYATFLARRTQLGGGHGFAGTPLPEWLFPFQRALVEWALRKGRAGIFADCGLGKTPMQLVWADTIARRQGRPVLIATPLAVSHQVLAEAEKFGIECKRSSDGRVPRSPLIVTNYERLHLFDPTEFCGMVADESSILKNFDGVRKAQVTEFMRKLPFRLLCTATAAPNDYTELGTSAEALGEMGHLDMLMRFFKNDQNSVQSQRSWDGNKWRFKHHAEQPFWRWCASWARALRKPSDLGCSDAGFILPRLTQREYVVETKTKRPGYLFDMPATNLEEEREERRRTITERCEKVAELVKDSDSALVWCHLNDEGDLLERIIPGAVQVAGKHGDDEKEERLLAFARGKVRVLVCKPKIGAWGLNLQHCAHVTFFPSHSYEQFYQGIRRCWRFGQKRPVRVDIVATEGERGIGDNLARKAAAADRMFAGLVEHMGEGMKIKTEFKMTEKEKVPSWL